MPAPPEEEGERRQWRRAGGRIGEGDQGRVLTSLERCAEWSP